VSCEPAGFETVLAPRGVALARAAQSVARARAEGRPRWLALSADEPPGRDALACFEEASEPDRFYWEHPAEGGALAAAGRCTAIEVSGADRFGRAGARARDLFARLDAESVRPAERGPLLVGGFAFEETEPREPDWKGFPSGLWVLPEILFRSSATGGRWTVCTSVSPADDPAELAHRLSSRLAAALDGPAGREAVRRPPVEPDFHTAAACSHEAWRERVRAALDAIAKGDLEKVVLARSVRVEVPGRLQAGRLLESLRADHPSCVQFAVARGDAVFLGATPERLLRFDASSARVETGALAGTGARGRSPAEDERLARALRECGKEQAEHAAVVRAIRDALRPRCGELQGPETPGCLALEGIRHLHTPLSGRVTPAWRGRVGLLELAGDLHPTPAVAGVPTDAARAWLRGHEELERGWYAGPVGYLDAEGGGELRVALRCALLRGGSAVLHAGAGIVAGSDPERELRETRLKLRALLGPLLEV